MCRVQTRELKTSTSKSPTAPVCALCGSSHTSSSSHHLSVCVCVSVWVTRRYLVFFTVYQLPPPNWSSGMFTGCNSLRTNSIHVIHVYMCVYIYIEIYVYI